MTDVTHGARSQSRKVLSFVALPYRKVAHFWQISSASVFCLLSVQILWLRLAALCHCDREAGCASAPRTAGASCGA